MGLGSIFSVFKKSKDSVSPAVPNLDSRQDGLPSGAFSDSLDSQSFLPQSFDSGNQNSQVQKGFDDLPDFPDFPDFSQQENILPEPAKGISPPKPIESPKPLKSVSFAKNVPEISVSREIEDSFAQDINPEDEKVNKILNAYDSVKTNKIVGLPPEYDSNRNRFVNIYDYKQTLEFIDSMKDHIVSFENCAMQLHDLSNTSNVTESNFRKIVEEIQRKLIFVDKTLFESHI